MKELRRNMRAIGILLTCIFIGVGLWFGITVYTQGSMWASNIYNQRVAKANSHRGDISDREGNILATSTEDGQRVYLSDEAQRRALVHTIGDTSGMSGTGVETYYSSTLTDLSTSIIDRLVELLNGSEHEGSSIQLTIDARLTAYISEQFPSGYDGAVVVINYKTGEILCMVSKPNYDPYDLLNRSGEVEVADSAYLNRCLQGLYTPGSTFKIITLASALTNEPDIANMTFTCTSEWKYEGGSVTCASGRVAHGNLDFITAFAKSCNTSFGKVAYLVGSEALANTAESFGYNENFKFDDITLYNSSFPRDIDSVSELVWSGIGQGEVLVTPLHAAMIAGAVANNGTMMEPKLVRNIVNSLGLNTYSISTETYKQAVPSDIAYEMCKYMYKAVESGTASNAKISGYTVCGKTGSAETSDDKTKETDAWFVGFVYDDSNPYAVAVVIEEGGAGSDLATKLGKTALSKAIEIVK